MLNKIDLEFVEKMQDAVNTHHWVLAMDTLVLLGYILRLNAECSRLRCCGNCRHYDWQQRHGHYSCWNEYSDDYDISVEPWADCRYWEERDVD